MRCLACGVYMRLVQVEQDNTMLVPGYEHRTWQCDGCGEAERRMTFRRENTPVEAVPVEPKHPTIPATKLKAGAWMHAIERLRSKQAELEDIAKAAERRAKFNRDWQWFFAFHSP
jgi:hypothetical protein